MSRPSCHRRKRCTSPHTSSLSGTADKVLSGLGCCRPVIQNYKTFGILDAAVWSMPSCHRGLICTGPHTTSLSGTPDRFLPGLVCCCPAIQHYKRDGRLDAAIKSMPSSHRRRICTGSHTSSLFGTSNRLYTNICCCVASYTFTNDVSS